MDDFLAMEILNALCDIEGQTNTIGGITVRIRTIPTSQEFHHVPIFHPGRHKAKSGFQDVLEKANTVEG